MTTTQQQRRVTKRATFCVRRRGGGGSDWLFVTSWHGDLVDGVGAAVTAAGLELSQPRQLSRNERQLNYTDGWEIKREHQPTTGQLSTPFICVVSVRTVNITPPHMGIEHFVNELDR